MIYTAYIALVVSFTLAIVLHGWFVHRLASLYERTRTSKSQYGKHRSEMISLVEEVDELERGTVSNGIAIQNLEREREELEEKLKAGVSEEEGDL